MQRFSFQEKLLFAQFAGLLVVGVFYAHFLRAGHQGFHAVLLAVLLLLGLFRLAIRRGSGDTVQDERDRTVTGIGAKWSNAILLCGLTIIFVVYYDLRRLQNSQHLMDWLFHLVLLAIIVRIIRQLVAYRRPL